MDLDEHFEHTNGFSGLLGKHVTVNMAIRLGGELAHFDGIWAAIYGYDDARVPACVVLKMDHPAGNGKFVYINMEKILSVVVRDE